MKVAISQSNYIPWKGYFDAINWVDHFILYDDAQYTKRDWRNRNKIITPQGSQWLSIPVEVKGKFEQAINQTQVSDAGWATKHWATIKQNYSKAPHWDLIREWLEPLYLGEQETHLSAINAKWIIAINQFLGIQTPIESSSKYQVEGDATERLVAYCQRVGATDYYSGPAAKNYMDEEKFSAANIRVHYYDYSNYPQYPQCYGDFDHAVSILDLLFNTGNDAPNYMKSFTATRV